MQETNFLHNYNDFIYHTNTNNLSFIKMYHILKKKGVRNNKFFLRLYDATLKNVDPLNEKSLTRNQKNRILAEIKRNPYYFLREILRIDAGAGTVRFELNLGVLAMSYCIFNSVDSITIMLRQRGKTVCAVACLMWIYFFGTKNAQMAFGNKSKNDSVNNLKRFKTFTELLPEYIKEAILHPKDVDNIESVNSKLTNNSIFIFQPSMNEEMAEKDARGRTVPLWWSDETAFHKFIEITMKSAGPAIRRISLEAEKNKKPHCRIITTTPNNIDIPEGNFVRNILIEGAAKFKEFLYDYTRDELRDYIDKHSQNFFLYIEYSWRDLGYSEEWYQGECRDLLFDWARINREVNCQWLKSNDNGVFDENTLVQINNLLVKVKKSKEVTIIKDNDYSRYYLDLYQDLDPEELYFIGVDTAGGLDNDNSAIIITNDEFKVIGSFRNNKINTSDFYKLLFEIQKLIPRSIFFIENNSYGKSIIDNLLELCPSNIYYFYNINDKDKRKNPKEATKSITYGINTNTSTRLVMFDMLIELVNNDMAKFAYNDIYRDLSTLIINKKGKIEHEIGCHDDSLMAYLMILYAFEHTNNIAHFIRKFRKNEGKNSFKNLTNKNITTLASVNFNLNDPALNKGMNINLDEVVSLMKNEGIPFEQALNVVKKRIEDLAKHKYDVIKKNDVSIKEKLSLSELLSFKNFVGN